MKLRNAKSSVCETSIAGARIGAESQRAPQGVDRQIELIPPGDLAANKSNARQHSKKQLEQIARSIVRRLKDG